MRDPTVLPDEELDLLNRLSAESRRSARVVFAVPAHVPLRLGVRALQQMVDVEAVEASKDFGNSHGEQNVGSSLSAASMITILLRILFQQDSEKRAILVGAMTLDRTAGVPAVVPQGLRAAKLHRLNGVAAFALIFHWNGGHLTAKEYMACTGMIWIAPISTNTGTIGVGTIVPLSDAIGEDKFYLVVGGIDSIEAMKRFQCIATGEEGPGSEAPAVLVNLKTCPQVIGDKTTCPAVCQPVYRSGTVRVWASVRRRDSA